MLAQFAGGIALICVWSTTALAIKWSVTGIDYTAALFIRFIIAFAVMFGILLLRRRGYPQIAQTWRAWLVAGGSTSVSMICTYWASQYISSGLVAVLHGLNPLITAALVHFWQKQHIERREMLGIAFAIGGLATIFSSHLHLRPDGLPALLAIMIAVFANSLAIIKLKEHSQNLDAFMVSTGSMAVCTLAAGILWFGHGMPVPETMSLRAGGALLYLALIGSVFALSVYFWMIRECRPTQISLIPMISTVSSVWLGHFLNDEALTHDILIGTGLIASGLLLHQFGAWRSR